MKVVCHRGANAIAPENTYAAAAPCIDWAADYLEIDVNTSADGIPYVFHGPGLERTTNGQGRIYDWNSDDLDQLDAGSWFSPDFRGEPLPRLEAFLDWIDHRIGLFFDIKWASLPLMIEIIRSRRLEEECFFWFGRDRFADELVALAPDLTLKLNVRSVADVEVAHRRGGAMVEFGLDDDVTGIISAARALGMQPMILQKEDNEQLFRAAIDSGADLINCDHADRFIALRDF